MEKGCTGDVLGPGCPRDAPPVTTAIVRVATKYDIIILGGSIIHSQGNVHHQVHVRGGDKVLAVLILALHTSRTIWSADAFEFRNRY